MKSLILILLCALPAQAEWGRVETEAVRAAAADRAEVQVIGGAPLTDLLADRYKAALPLELGGARYFATVMFDAEWNEWFTLKPEGGGTAAAWPYKMLEAGVVCECGGRELRLRKAGDAIHIESRSGRTEVSVNSLFDLLYGKSVKITFGGLVPYAVFRNLEPLSEGEGTVALRLGSDGLYYYSLTPDKNIEGGPRWLLAVNGVLYGLRIADGSLLFVSKKIELDKVTTLPERPVAR
jgi:hypothetical protein